MNKLTDTDLHFVASRIPKDIRDLMKEHGLFLGGGFIRATIAGEQVSDFDLFGANKNDLEKIGLNFALARKARVSTTKNAVTVICPPHIPVQFITRWVYNDMESLVRSFDFTVCQAAISCRFNNETKKDEWGSCISEDFYPDLAARRLNYTMPDREEDAGGSLLRVRKYLSRGYTIQAISLAKVVANLMQGVKASLDLLSDKPRLAAVLSGLLREVDPFIVVDGIDLLDEHETL